MCGRYSISETLSNLRTQFGFTNSINLQPRYNLAPTQDAPVVRLDDGGLWTINLLRWGVEVEGLKTKSVKGVTIINARAETINQKVFFKNAFEQRRCLVVADGYYEWKQDNKNGQPYRIVTHKRKPFAFAGLWGLGSRCAYTGFRSENYVIITMNANADTVCIHPRAPVILGEDEYETWLGPNTLNALDILNAHRNQHTQYYKVSPKVGDVRNDCAELQECYEHPQRLLF